MAARVSRRKNLSSASETVDPEPLLRISEVARRVGISSSALRAWESLGLVVPQRTPSKYRLYTMEDVRVLQRAIFLLRSRGERSIARSAIPPPPPETQPLARASRACDRCLGRFSQRARARPDARL